MSERLEGEPITSIECEPAVRVRLLTAPSLWCWDIVDPDGRLVASSWADEWEAFVTRDEATTAGARRLAELVAPARR